MEDTKKSYLAINVDQRLIRELESRNPFYDDRYKIISDDYEIIEDPQNNIIKIKYKRMDWRTTDKDFEHNDGIEYPLAVDLKKNKIVKGMVYLKKDRGDWQTIEFVGNYVKANVKHEKINALFKQFVAPANITPEQLQPPIVNQSQEPDYKKISEQINPAKVVEASDLAVLTTRKFKFYLGEAVGNNPQIVVEMKELVREQTSYIDAKKQITYDVFVEADDEVKNKAIGVVKNYLSKQE